MRSRNHYTGHGLFQPDGITEFRRRAQALENIYIETVRRKHIGGYERKFAAVVAVVMRYAQTGSVRPAGFPYIIGKSLCRHTYRITVHPVSAGSHYTAQTAGSEFKVLVKRIFKGGRVAFHQNLYFLFGRFIEISVKPTLGDCPEIFFHNLNFLTYHSKLRIFLVTKKK